MKKAILLTTSFLFCLTITLFGQSPECSNGIDDDNDGFIDCFDPDRDGGTDCQCGTSYVGNDAECEVLPGEFPEFTMTLDFATPDETANHLGRIAIGDLDRDGIPEIISDNKYTDKIFVLNGDDGSIKYSKDVDYQPQWEAAIANLNNDNCGEIFMWGYKDKTNYFIAYDCQLNELWREPLIGDPGNYGLADFNRDGKVELYARNEIRDAATGVAIIGGNSWGNVNAGPVAVDIDGDLDLELVLGGIIYTVDLGSGTAGSGTLTELKKIPDYYIRNRESDGTSVADYNQDGFLDVVAVGSDGGKNKNTTIFFWDVEHNIVKKFIDKIPDLYLSLSCQNNSPNYLYKNGWTNGAGRVNIADLDGDGNLNASFVSGRYLYALDENFDQLWRVVINEETSGFTGCTLFDFNGDGKSEVVYRDEQYVYIINGENGKVLTSQRCISRTNREYPIVADVDADGSTELCVPCGYDDAEAWNKFCNLKYSRYSHIRAYKSNSEPWVPARRVWNQHGYFNVNVNDNLTIPQTMQKHHLIWSTGTCTEGPNRPLNKFLNQSPFINSQGCPTYIAPNLAFDQSGLTIKNPTCPDREFSVTFQITNIGDAALAGLLPISFYNGDPLQTGAVLLGTEYFDVGDLPPGEVIDVNDLPLTGPGSPFKLYIVLNDNGTTVPSPITLPNSNFLECDYVDNVITGDVNPLPFQVETEVTPNITCSGNAVPANGSARVWRNVSGAEETADYIFDWYAGTDLTAAPVYSGAVFSGLSAGTYTVIATHKTAKCASDPVEVTIVEQSSDVSAEIVLEKNFTNCKNPNGKLRVIADDGEPVGNYTYQWYEGNIAGSGPIISTSHVATNLKPISYSVIVKEKATGCETIESYTMEDKSEPPPATSVTITDINCTSSNNGAVSVVIQGDPDDYSFEWYNGTAVKSSPDYTGTDLTGLAAGKYTLKITDKKDKCSRDSLIEILQTLPPVISGVTSTPQTSCNPNAKTGSVSVQYAGSSSDFLVEWFAGQNTLSSNKKGEGNTLNGLAQGIYTVKLTNLTTQCFSTAEVTVKNKIQIPLLSATPAAATTCVPNDGSVTASVDVGNTDDYTFFWYNGDQVKGSPDYAEEGSVLTSVSPGTYTVFAINNISGCEVSAPATVTVLDNTPVLDITQTQENVIPPSDCNDSGSLEISVSKSGDPSAVFTINWYKGNAPFTDDPIKTTTGVASDMLTGISAGIYSAEAIDPVSGCSSIRPFTLDFVSLQTVEVSVIDATQCVPLNGGMDLTLDAKGLDETDFIMEVYEGSNPVGPVLETINGISGQTNYQTSLIYSTGEFTVVAINIAPGFNNCQSIPKSATIGSNATGPVLAIAGQTDNSACEGSPFNGLIDIEIDGGAPAGNYSITWYEGQNATTAPLLGTNVGIVTSGGLRAEQLRGGVYLVNVTNSIGCETSLSVTLQDDAPILSIDVTPMHIATCDALGNLTNGTAHAQAQDEGTDVGGYTYSWTDVDGVNLGSGQDIASLAPGTYYVTIFNGLNGCGTVKEFVIEDQTINNPDIQLVGFEDPTRCLQTANLTGYIEINVTGTSSSGYDIIWREDDASGSEVVSYKNSNILDNLINDANFTVDQKSYHVTVINRDTQCRDTELYTLNREVVPITLSASATDVTICDETNPDGTLFATVTSGGPNNYHYQWSNSTGDLFVGKNYTGVGAGSYTITASDNLDNFCSTDSTLMIFENQIMPELMVEKIAPNHACIDSLADGVARATVNGSYIGYTFEWYEGTDISGTPAYTGSQFFGMKAMTYTVVVTDNVNTCSDIATVTIDQEMISMPDPTALVLAHQTSCEEPNGVVAANVNGNTSDYIFDWYSGSEVKDTPDFTAEVWAGVPAGFYTVTATSKITGCLIGPVTVEVLEDYTYPDFDFDIQNPTCDDNNGFVKIILNNSVEISSVVWTGDDGTRYVGPNLTEVPGGVYEVTATSYLGCTTTKTMELLADINPNNGISRNGDSRNDYFRIGCISDYPQNMVKIFNRAGTLVYEMEGYDNATNFFNGTSNKGISLMGLNLPDGTYYYVIDKQDGSKPLAGYLEIVQ